MVWKSFAIPNHTRRGRQLRIPGPGPFPAVIVLLGTARFIVVALRHTSSMGHLLLMNKV